MFHYLSAFACKTRVCSWRVLEWTARQSSGGFSVTFFWPAPNQEIKPTAKPSAKKKRRKRRSRSARPKGLCADLGNEHASSSTSGKHDSAAVRTPIDAHHRTNSEKVAYSHAPECPDSNADDSQLEDSSLAPTKCETDPLEYAENLQCDQYCQSSVKVSADSHLDLTNCDSVVYEMKDGIPGMKFTAGGRDGWTPVRKRRCQT